MKNEEQKFQSNLLGHKVKFNMKMNDEALEKAKKMDWQTPYWEFLGAIGEIVAIRQNNDSELMLTIKLEDGTLISRYIEHVKVLD